MAKVFVAEAYAYLREVVDRGHFTADEAIAGRILQGKAMSAADYINAVEEQRRDRAAFAPWLADYDAIILPTSAIAAVKVADCDRFNPIMALLTRWVNHLGLCALAVPCGFTRSGLPISLQIVGAPFDESRILRIGWTYEQATDWHKKHPSL